MPELPEVERVATQLSQALPGQRISKAKIYTQWNRIPDDLREKVWRQIVDEVYRHGKYLFIRFGRRTLMVHLGMSGRFRITGLNGHHRKHEHYSFTLPNCRVFYGDPRRFGRIEWTSSRTNSLLSQDLRQEIPQYNLGIDALDRQLDPKLPSSQLLWKQHFFSKFLETAPIKSCLLEQRGVAGIGNIYANEILFACRVHPETAIGRLSKYERRLIGRNSWKILRMAIKHGGTSLKGANKYRDSKSRAGKYVKYLAVYNRDGNLCPECDTAIVKTKLRSRATYFCPKCQVRDR